MPASKMQWTKRSEECTPELGRVCWLWVGGTFVLRHLQIIGRIFFSTLQSRLEKGIPISENNTIYYGFLVNNTLYYGFIFTYYFPFL